MYTWQNISLLDIYMKTFISTCSLIGLPVMSSDELAVDYALYGAYLTHHTNAVKNWKRVMCSLINKRENTEKN